MSQLTMLTYREDKSYVALCPALDIASQGETVEVARKNLTEALELFLEQTSLQEIADRLRFDHHGHSNWEQHNPDEEIRESVDARE